MIFLAVARAGDVGYLATFLLREISRERGGGLADGVNLYWWKRLTPPIAYGAKQAIMFQMMLLPLTMARQTVAAMSNTYFGRKLVPLHKIFAMHVYLGYVAYSLIFRRHDSLFRFLRSRLRAATFGEGTVTEWHSDFFCRI